MSLRVLHRWYRRLPAAASLHAWLLLCLPLAAHAQHCAFNLRVQFADGAIGCLDDYAFFQRVDRTWSPRGTHLIALAPAAIGCAPAMAVSNATDWNTNIPEAERSLLRACGLQANKGVEGCDCRIVYSNGRSSLSLQEFEQFAGAPRRQVGSGSPVAAVPTGEQRAPDQAANASPARASVPASDGRGASASQQGALRAAERAVEAAYLASAWASEVESCPARFIVTFADDARRCLTSFPLVDREVGSLAMRVRTAVPGNGVYYLAASPAGDQCTPAVGFGRLTGADTGDAMAAALTRRAMDECTYANAASAPGCGCRLVIARGRSDLSAAEFERYAGAPATASATREPGRGGSPGLAAAESSKAEGVAVAQPPAALGADKAATADEVAALRRQVEELLQQRTQVQPSLPAQTPPMLAAESPRRTARALVIGNGAYANLGILPNPRRDAQAIAAKLRSLGIDVDLVLDAGRERLVQALSNFQLRSAGADVNLLFYAGHGLQVGGVNYIVPVDMKGEGATAGSVKLNTVSLNDALEYLPAATRVVFLDACRDNPIARSLRATRGGSSGLAAVDAASGTLISFATKDGAVAEDGAGANSPYTTALLRHLDAPLDVAIVLRRVRQEVLQSTGNRQEPWEYGSLVGDQLVLAHLTNRAR